MRANGQWDGIVTYAFLFEGGSLADDRELDLILPAHYGEEEAQRFIRDWVETFAPSGNGARLSEQRAKKPIKPCGR